MSFFSKTMVMSAAAGIVLQTDPSPVIERITQSLVASVAHDDLPSFSALACHRGHSPISPQRVIISVGQRLCSLDQHRGGYDASHSRQGREHLDVTMPLSMVVFS